MRFDILLLGSLTIDEIAGEIRAGGPALYSFFASKVLGVRLFTIGTVGEDFPWDLPEIIPGIFVKYRRTISFSHYYDELQRRKSVLRAGPEYPVALEIEGLLKELKPKAIIVNPVFHEFSYEIIASLIEQGETVAVDIQGFLRSVDEEGHIRLEPLRPEVEELLNRATIVKVSDDERFYVPRKLGEIFIATKGPQGSELHNARDVKIDAPVVPIPGDPTGAGDVFLLGFVGCYVLGKDIVNSLTCGQALASMVVDPGIVPRVPSTSFRKEVEDLEANLPTLRDIFYERVKKLAELIREI